MPWKSEAQRAWAHATDQPWADKWDEHTPKNKKLPKRVGKKKKSKTESIIDDIARMITDDPDILILPPRR